MSETLIALIGTLFGGIGLKLFESFINRSKSKDDTATQIRKELREETLSLREENIRLDGEVNEWREKYYVLFEQFIKVKADLEQALRDIKRQASTAEHKLGQQTPNLDKP